MTTALVDYESGNLHSAAKAFERMSREAGAGKVIITSDPDEVARADRIVLPGDGAFPACRAALFDHSGLFEAIEQRVMGDARPFMGICIGMQMLASQGLEYEPTDGFNWIKGVVGSLTAGADKKIPHMGWNDLIITGTHPVLEGVSTGDHAYFVHSYHMRVSDLTMRLAHTEYGEDVTAVVGHDTVIGTQFHPEKSQATGLRMIANFLNWAP